MDAAKVLGILAPLMGLAAILWLMTRMVGGIGAGLGLASAGTAADAATGPTAQQAAVGTPSSPADLPDEAKHNLATIVFGYRHAERVADGKAKPGEFTPPDRFAPQPEPQSGPADRSAATPEPRSAPAPAPRRTPDPRAVAAVELLAGFPHNLGPEATHHRTALGSDDAWPADWPQRDHTRR
jgi:hypothetical protein